MKNYIAYNSITGEILDNVSTHSPDNLSPYPFDFSYLEVIDPVDNSKYYINPQLQETVAFPDKPDQYHTWNWTTKIWEDVRTTQQKYNQTARQIQVQRTQLLNDSDWVVVKALEQGTTIPENWHVYRQQLRDITLQPNYPFTVTWPASPNQ
jgi:hypothetical protein